MSPAARTVEAPVGAQRRGRPRDESVDAAITAAAIDELVERGFLALTMEGVAARAGVAKTTLYRRWPSVLDLALDAMLAFEDDDPEPPPGPPREQLLYLLDSLRRRWNDPTYAAIMRRVAADGTSNPELYRRGRDKLIAPNVRRVNNALARCVDEGLIRPDADIEAARRMLTSPLLAAGLTHKGRISQAQIEYVLDTVLRGLAP